jgi:glutamyl/glutaminyl-tRNA synthetase
LNGQSKAVGRFAPSLTGEAHPGTLLAALLCWLDARSRGGTVLLRLEDLDRGRFRPGFDSGMLEALEWLGLSFDHTYRQSDCREDHEAALDQLTAAGRLYPCSCSRSRIRRAGRRAPDGGFAYDNLCRERTLPAGGWRESEELLRLRLPDERIELIDQLGRDLSQQPALEMGDPVVVRRDGTVAYHLAVVVDDAAASVTHVVRGQDLASSTATQIMIYQLLGKAVPTYLHHFLLLEGEEQKLAKMHGSIGYCELAKSYSGPGFCGLLARLSGLRDTAEACTPSELLADFDWKSVRRTNVRFAE